MLAQVRPSTLQHEAQDSFQIKAFGQLNSRFGDRAEQPFHAALLQVAADIADKVAQPGFDPGD
jgi:hypothetical protein